MPIRNATAFKAPLLGAFAVMALVMAACPSATADDNVVLQLKWSHQFQFAGYYAAIEKGYYADAGLAVTLAESSPQENPAQEVLTGRADYGVDDAGTLLGHRLNGLPLVVMAAIFQHSPQIVLSLEDADISAPKDLAGQRVAMGEGVEAGLILALLNKEGIALADVDARPFALSIEELIEGRCDAATAYITNWPYLLERHNVPYRIINPRSYGLDFYGDCLYTTESEMADNPDRARRFLEASLLGWEYALKNTDELIDIIRTKYAKDIPEDVLLYEAQVMERLVVPGLVQIGHMNPARWGHMADTYASIGLVDPGFSLNGFLYAPRAASRVATESDFDYLRWLAGITIVGGFIAALVVSVLLLFNQRLRRAVTNHTAALRNLNDELVGEVAERKRSQEALQESEERLSITLNSIGDAVIATDIAGRISLLNPVAAILTGWSQTEAQGRLLSEVVKLVEADRHTPITNPVQQVLRAGRVVGLSDRVLLVDKEGKERHVAPNGAPIFDRKREIVGVVLVFRDMSEKSSLEEQFIESQKLESVGRLAGGIAHDFNNLLGGILGYAEILSDQLREDQKLGTYARSIMETANRAADLTKQLLAFSRKGNRQSVPVDVHDLIRDVIAILQRTVDPRIVINQRLQALPSMTKGDPSQLESALLNLAVNARDAMPKGGEILVTSATVSLDHKFCEESAYEITPGRYVELSVVDTGIGIDKATMEHIFEPFFTTKSVGKGTGLGLAAVFGTVKEHHGAITVFSEPGQGSAFRIYLPLLEEDVQAAPSEVDTIVRGTGCILIVDDEEVIRNMAREMLTEMGYEVLWASDGAEGVRVFRENAAWVDLVLLDLVMPKVNGQVALQAMRKVNPEIRVLVATGFNLGIEFDALREQGVHGFIKKPFRRAELSRAVAATIAGTPWNDTF